MMTTDKACKLVSRDFYRPIQEAGLVQGKLEDNDTITNIPL